MRRVISRPPTRPATSALAPLDWLPHPARHYGRQPIVSAAIVIYRPDDLRFRLHQRRYQTVPGRPQVSSDSSARDRSYILADDSAAHRWYLLTACHLLPRPRISGCVARIPFPPAQPSQDTALRPLRNVATVHPTMFSSFFLFSFLFRLFPSRRRRAISS